jgi:ribosomal protein S18 acetylase RimI-like enzyme
MPPNVAIIRADLSHVPAVTPLFDAYRQFYQQAPDLDRARAFVTDRLTRGESVIFLAVSGGKYNGFTQLYPSYSSVDMAKLWILNDLFVDPAARGQGVGEALLEHARRFAEETGARSLMLETAVDNLSAQRLYERLGWVRETQFYMYYLHL